VNFLDRSGPPAARRRRAARTPGPAVTSRPRRLEVLEGAARVGAPR